MYGQHHLCPTLLSIVDFIMVAQFLDTVLCVYRLLLLLVGFFLFFIAFFGTRAVMKVRNTPTPHHQTPLTSSTAVTTQTHTQLDSNL